MPTYNTLPPNLPAPTDDGAAAHLPGLAIPDIALPATTGETIHLAQLGSGRTVLYAYPMTGVPGEPLPEGWNEIPGARGCTPQACSFRDHHAELLALGVNVLGLSTQTTDYQHEMVTRLELPYPVLSDADFALTNALTLPTMEVHGIRLLKRITLILRNGRIEAVLYPVFPPDRSADDTLAWLNAHPATEQPS